MVEILSAAGQCRQKGGSKKEGIFERLGEPLCSGTAVQQQQRWAIQGILGHESADASGINIRISILI